VGAGQRVREPRGWKRPRPSRWRPAEKPGRLRRPWVRFAELRVPSARGPSPSIFLWSRAAIWAAALFAWLVFEPNRHPLADRWDDPLLTRDLGWVTDVWARWDSVWFLRIAEHGYGTVSGVASAFYPLYPLTLAGVGRAFGGHYVLAGIVVSLAATLVSFVLLQRLAEERLGADGARRAVLYLAVFPMSLFLQAVYSESLFLALVLGAFLLAERGRWLGAGTVTGLAVLTRISGVALLPALAVLAWRRPERSRALASLCVAPLVFAAYPLYLGLAQGDAFAFARSQGFWNRHLSPAGPFGGIWDGLRAGWAGVQQLASGSHTHYYWAPVRDADPMRVAAVNLEALAFLVLLVGLTVIAWRRFGAPYGLFSAVSLAIPLSVPSERWPLLSLPRFGLVLFPCFLALAVLGGRPRVHTGILVVSSIMLGVAVTQWALWQWVA
jgi:Mannosyltransferase (PIG-V)